MCGLIFSASKFLYKCNSVSFCIYFTITICTYNKSNLFGDVNRFNEFGKIAEDELHYIPRHFKGVKIHKYIIMPNHIHAIISIGCDIKTEDRTPCPTLSTMVGLCKAGVSKRIHAIQPNLKIWQKSFYDHIIRNEQSFREVWQYIDENPLKWAQAE